MDDILHIYKDTRSPATEGGWELLDSEGYFHDWDERLRRFSHMFDGLHRGPHPDRETWPPPFHHIRNIREGYAKQERGRFRIYWTKDHD